MAVLTVSIGAPLRGLEMRGNGPDQGAESGTVWFRTCGAEQNLRARTVMQAPSYADRPCSADGGEPVETAELSPSQWAADGFEESFSVSEFSSAPSRKQVSAEQAASFVADLAAMPPGETPAGAKVPEPGTLMLLGAGMIAMSRVSRIKSPPKIRLRMAVARLGIALLR